MARQSGARPTLPAGSHAAARQRRTRHQGTAVHPVLQPVARVSSAIPISSPSVRADLTSASSSASRRTAWRSKPSISPTTSTISISLGPFDPDDVQRAVRKHRRDTRVRPRARGHGVRQRRTAIRRRLYVSRFESHPQHEQQPDLRAGTILCIAGRVIPAPMQASFRAIA